MWQPSAWRASRLSAVGMGHIQFSDGLLRHRIRRLSPIDPKHSSSLCIEPTFMPRSVPSLEPGVVVFPRPCCEFCVDAVHIASRLNSTAVTLPLSFEKALHADGSRRRYEDDQIDADDECISPTVKRSCQHPAGGTER